MMETMHWSPLSPEAARQVDQICDRFEAAWRSGPPPRIEDFLEGHQGAIRSEALRQLILLDWEYAQRAGQNPSPHDYVERFPADSDVIEQISRELTEGAASTFVNAQGGSTVNGSQSPTAPVRVPRRVGLDRYELLDEIGHGGIGIVYRSHDNVLGRELAVKLLRESYRHRTEARERFFNEARIGSQLQHPAIVPVYEVGDPSDGSPYFTMKLVDGRTLAELLTDRSDPSHDLQRFLAIFAQVCQAMAYAHAHGVIHRDLKPTNIMVGAFGEVQVMDWGFAKALGNRESGTENREEVNYSLPVPDARSVSGIMMGTPAYMPPEQACGKIDLIDQRTDVFALGAILCEILTGKPAYIGSVDDVCRLASAGELRDAHDRLNACSADESLRTLARHCLEVDQAKRPADAGVVAAAVTAYMASAQERLQQAQVERAGALAKAAAERRARRWIGGLALALLVGAGVAVWQAVVATYAKREAIASGAAEVAAKTTAMAKEKETKSVFTFFRDRVLEAARPAGTAGGLGKDATIRAALDRAEPEIAKTFSDQPAAEALVRYTLGQNYYYLGEQKKALRQNQLALALQRQHLPPDHPDTLATLNMVAVLLKEFGDLEGAAKLFDETLQAKRRVRGTETRSTLLTMVNLAGVLVQLRRYDQARLLYDEALPIEKRILGPTDNLTLDTMSGIAIMFINERKYEEARTLAEETFQLKEKFLTPEHISTMGTLCILAGATEMTGRVDEAISLYEEALRRQRHALPEGHRDTLRTMYHLGTALITKKRFEEAAKLFRETADTQSRVLHPEHPNTLRSMSGLAVALDGLGQLEEAHEMFARVLEIERRTLPENHPQTLDSMYNLANSLFKLGRWEESRKLHEETIPLKKRVLGREDPETIKSIDSLAWLLVIAPEAKYRDPAQAIQLAKEVVQSSPTTGPYWTTLGAAHYREGHWDDALTALTNAESNNPGSRSSHNAFFLAMSHWQAGHKDEAQQWFDKAIERLAENKPDNDKSNQLRTEAAKLLGRPE